MEASTEVTKQNKIMMGLVDKLCDHLPTERIKLFIDNGFDEWETITYLKGEQLVQLGYTSQECIIIMVAINSNCKQHGFEEIFDQQKINKVLQQANIQDQKRMEKALSQQKQNKKPQSQNQMQGTFLKQQIKIQPKQYPKKSITEQILLKSVASKLSKTQKQKSPLQILSKITLIQLQNHQITDLQQDQLKKLHEIQNLYLAYNRIIKICGLKSLTKIKILKLENNQILKIEGLQSLCNLEQLTINDNLIVRVQNLQNNKRLHYLNVSNQKHKYNVELDQYSFDSLSYCLQKFECNNNRVKDIDSLKHLAVVQEIYLKNNLLSQIGDLTVALNQMERLKKIDFKGNPLTKVPKYRDYIVILSKNLEQLDDKKILPKQREYLVKLYSLKHAKQQKQKTEGGEGSNKNISSKKQLDLHGIKMDQNDKIGRYMMNGGNNDLRGNAPFANTKVTKK